MSLLEIIFDPFVLFCVGCIVTPPLVDKTLSRDAQLDYFTHPAMLFCAALLIITYVYTFVVNRQRVVKLAASKRMLARWYLLNGVIIHILMDGLVGVYKANQPFATQYAKLDKRYGADVGTFLGSAVHIVSAMELFVKGPLCILLYIAYHHNLSIRDPLELITCATQIYGTVVYLGQEWLTGGHNFDVDWNLTFSMHYLLYFWFAVFFGCLLYFVVPGILGYWCFTRIAGDAARRR